MKESATKKSFVNGDSGRHAPLAMDAAIFRKLGHRLVDQLAGLSLAKIRNTFEMKDMWNGP